MEKSDYIPPSDSRFREDMRLMEEGNFKEAYDKKIEFEKLTAELEGNLKP